MKHWDAGSSPPSANSTVNWEKGGTYAGPVAPGVPWGHLFFAQQAIVKNTFVDVVDCPPEEDRRLKRRSASMSDISRSSSELDSTPHDLGYWLPSLSSTSSGESREKSMPGNVENGAPWLQKHMERQGSNLEEDSAALLPWSPGMAPENHNLGQESRNNDNNPPRNFRGMLHGGPNGAIRPTEPLDTMEQYSSDNAGLTEVLRNGWNPKAITKANERQTEIVRESGDSNAEREHRVRIAHEELGNRVPLEKIQELDRRGVLELIPRDGVGRLTSVGSMEHGSKCTPCAYWFKGICKYSIRCHYCHLMHDGQKSKRLRPSKQTRMRIRRWKDQAEDKADNCTQDGVPMHDNAIAEKEEEEERWRASAIDERIATVNRLSKEFREAQLRLQQQRARQQASSRENISARMLNEEAARPDLPTPAAEAVSLEEQLSSELKSGCKHGLMKANMITRL